MQQEQENSTGNQPVVMERPLRFFLRGLD